MSFGHSLPSAPFADLLVTGRIYAFDPLNLTHAAPLAVYSHPKALYGTFYIRVAVSPCSRFIASGSSEGGVYTWDAEGNGQDAVRMVGHEKETSGLDWGGKDRVSSCTEISSVRSSSSSLTSVRLSNSSPHALMTLSSASGRSSRALLGNVGRRTRCSKRSAGGGPARRSSIVQFRLVSP